MLSSGLMDEFLLANADVKPRRVVEPKFKKKTASSIEEAIHYLNQGYAYIGFSYPPGIRDRGAAFIGESFGQHKLSSLIKLSLDHQRISDKGASLLFASLEVNQTLEKLDIQSNSFGTKSLRVLGEALKVNVSLRWLDLGNNKFGDNGLNELISGLAQNKGLEFLSLR